jgi:hypothetical protein
MADTPDSEYMTIRYLMDLCDDDEEYDLPIVVNVGDGNHTVLMKGAAFTGGGQFVVFAIDIDKPAGEIDD